MSFPKEFINLVVPDVNEYKKEGLNYRGKQFDFTLKGFSLKNSQQFVVNFLNPNTTNDRLLLNWQTGTGKTIAAISIAQEFTKLYSSESPWIYIIGFNYEIFIKDMLKYPELGLISLEEKNELQKLELYAKTQGTIAENNYRVAINRIKRKIKSHVDGGYYKFFGYGEFANELFQESPEVVTQAIHEHKLEEYIAENRLTPRKDILNNIKKSLLICDEIHNTYNAIETNKYGISIQYVLDTLGKDSPKVLLLSATPLTSSATEVVDLLNLLVPIHKSPLKRKIQESDLWEKDELKPNALELIKKMAYNRVSFLINHENVFPEQIFIGESISSIPYLKFIKCPISKLHEEACFKIDKIGANKTTLYDMVFPGKIDDKEVGIFDSIELRNQYNERAPFSFATIKYEKDNIFMSGTFLQRNMIGKYSGKYAQLIDDLIELFKTPKSGKILIFHDHIGMSGTLLLCELLKYNGIIDKNSGANKTTLCSVCGIANEKHSKQKHDFKPIRFISITGLTEKNMQKNLLELFNSDSNIYGEEIKICIGSKVIREGLNFKAIRHQIILALPISIPILIQVLGRAVRHASHIKLPVEYRNVHVRIYVSYSTKYSANHEINRYTAKSKSYMQIQKIELALREGAIDGFVNYSKMKKSFEKNTLESLKYIPDIIDPKPLDNKSSFYAYYSIKEVHLLKKIILLCFKQYPAWTYDDLWEMVKTNRIDNTQYNISAVEEGNFVLALSLVCKHNNIAPLEMNNTKLYIITYIDEKGKKVVDYDSHIRKFVEPKCINVSLNRYLQSNKEQIFQRIYQNLKDYTRFITQKNSEFHYRLIEKIIIGEIEDPIAKKIYLDTKIMITDKSFQKEDLVYTFKCKTKSHKHDETCWTSDFLHKHNISERINENDKVIGDLTENNKIIQFKLRPPITQRFVDARSIYTGVICHTISRPELEKYIKLLNIEIDKNSTSQNMCQIIYDHMYDKEIESRKKNGIRWMYFFNEKSPNPNSINI